MAQSIADIKKGMTDMFVADTSIIAAYGLTPGLSFEDQFSVVSIESLIFYFVAFCCWLQQVLFDTVQADMNATIAIKKPHTLRWYAEAARLYQFGFPLSADHSGFDNTGYTDDDVQRSLVVSFAAVTEEEDISGRVFLRMKLAHDNGTDLEPLQPAQLDSFKDWFNTTQKDAGVKLQIDSLPADSLLNTWVIYYDPLILSATGARLDGSSATPVQDAIKEYLKNLPFNGVYAPTYHIDAVQEVPGVVVPMLQSCQASYGNLPYFPVTDFYTPDAGYLRFLSPSDLTISFIAKTPVK